MTEPEWVEWVKYYSAIQGLSSNADLAMLSAWKLEFLSAAKADLDEALRRLLDSDQVLRYRTEHRRFLHVHLNEIRRQKQRVVVQEIEDTEERYRCSDCHGSGHVLIPHPSAIRNGIWDFKTELAVSCTCALGQNRAQRFNAQAIQHEFQPIQDLLWADTVLPEWREMMAEKKRKQKNAATADEFTTAADRAGPMRVNRDLFKKAAKDGAA